MKHAYKRFMGVMGQPSRSFLRRNLTIAGNVERAAHQLQAAPPFPVQVIAYAALLYDLFRRFQRASPSICRCAADGKMPALSRSSSIRRGLLSSSPKARNTASQRMVP